jgi:hypothetical protein
MKDVGKLLVTILVAFVLAIAAPAASAYWGWGGGPWGPGYAPGWSHPYGGWRQQRPLYWDEPYEFDPFYQNAPASVRSDIRRMYRYGPGYRPWGHRPRGWW